MKIELNKTQYKTLLKSLFLANWIVNSHKEEEPDDEFDRLEQHVLSQTKFFDFKQFDFDEQSGKYYHSMEFEEKCLKHLDTFMDEAFWEELIERLALRDFLAAYSEKDIREMSDQERFTNRCRLQEPYEQEFSRHGLDNLIIRPVT